MYGWNCDEADSQWEPVPVATGNLIQFLDRGQENGFFEYGDCDLWITTKNRDDINIAKAEFRLCHEADIHFVSADKDFVAVAKASWLAKGWTVYQGTGEPGCEWTIFP
jgi:hypothetical protein